MMGNNKAGIRNDNAEERSDNSSPKVTDSGRPTATRANGGTRSSPPRVGGTGDGEVVSVKARSASAARESAAHNDAADGDDAPDESVETDELQRSGTRNSL